MEQQHKNQMELEFKKIKQKCIHDSYTDQHLYIKMKNSDL